MISNVKLNLFLCVGNSLKFFFKRKEFRKVVVFVWVVAHCRLVEDME